MIKKVTVTSAADSTLEEMRNLVLASYDLGRISKQDLLSWIVLSFRETSFEKSITKIRKDHEDPVLILKAKIRSIQETRKAIKPV